MNADYIGEIRRLYIKIFQNFFYIKKYVLCAILILFQISNSHMRFILTFIVVLVTTLSFAQTPELHHRVKINTGKDGLSKLAKAGIAVDHGTIKKGFYIITDISASELEAVKATGLTYTVLIEDVSKHYSERNQKKSAEKPTGVEGCTDCEEYATPLNFQLGTMGGFYTYQEMLNALDSMKAKYPNLITTRQAISTATTVQGRSLYFVKISDNAETAETEPQVLYTALHHAREPQSLSQLVFYMWYLLENYATNAEVRYLVDHTEMYFVPCINPDGYIYNHTTNPNGGGMWRKNRRNNGTSMGVDINRNYGKFWGHDNEGSSPNGNSETYRGPAAFSEPETQMIRDFCNAHEFKIALNAHTFSNLLIYPWGHEPSLLTPDSTAFQTMAHDMAECSGFLTGTGDMTVGYVTNGDSDDWMYGEQATKGKIFAMTPEAGDSDDGFWPLTQRIIPIAKQTMDQNLDAAKLVTAYAKLKVTDEPVLGQINSKIHFDLQRTGLSAGNFTVSLTPISSNIAAVGAPKSFINPAHLATLSDSISITLNTTATVNNRVQFLITWENNNGFVQSDTVTRYFGNIDTAFYSNGNTLDSFTSSTWGLSINSFVTSTGSITDSPNGDYTSNANTTITSKGEIDLSDATAAYLSYFARWDIEAGFDYVEIAASENGTTFNALCGRYNHKGNENQDNTVAVYDGTQEDWVKEYIDLTDYLGKKIKLRFSLRSDQGLEKDGFYFDEFAVVKIAADSSVSIKNKSLQTIELNNVPNPCTVNTDIYYKLPSTKGEYKLIITDVLGKTVTVKNIDPTKSFTKLDVTNLQSGVYFYRIISNSNNVSVTKKMIVQQ